MPVEEEQKISDRTHAIMEETLSNYDREETEQFASSWVSEAPGPSDEHYPRFELYQKDEEWGWRFRGPDGNILAEGSESYRNKTRAQNAILEVRQLLA